MQTPAYSVNATSAWSSRFLRCQSIVVMQTVQYRNGNDFPVVRLLLFQFWIGVRYPIDTLMKTPVIVPGHIFLQDPVQMPLIEDDDMVQTLSSYGSTKPLLMSVRIGDDTCPRTAGADVWFGLRGARTALRAGHGVTQ